MYFHKVAYVQYLGEVDTVSHTQVKNFFLFTTVQKNYKNRSRFSKVMVTNVLPPLFMVHSVCLLEYKLIFQYKKQIIIIAEVHSGTH